MKDWKSLYRTAQTEERYNETVIDHFMHPRNVGRLEQADGWGKVGDPACGDYLEMSFRLDRDRARIENICFLVYGCPAAVASSSITTELAKGRTIEEAQRLIEKDVLRALGGLPSVKVHCSVLSVRALREALRDYERCREMLAKGQVSSVRQYRERCNAEQMLGDDRENGERRSGE